MYFPSCFEPFHLKEKMIFLGTETKTAMMPFSHKDCITSPNKNKTKQFKLFIVRECLFLWEEWYVHCLWGF